jgi:nucleotide-binding universal stress UspA family protein
MRLLVPTDGSDESLGAVRYAIRLAREMPGSEIHLLNVQPPLHGTAARFVSKDAVRDYHLDEGRKALAAAEALLREAGMTVESHIAVGDPGETINGYCAAKSGEMIVMGTRGGGAVRALLGSTANDVLHHAKVPVTLVK